MPIRIIEADPEKDIDHFLALLNRNRKKKSKRNRFEWLYLNNPQGRAKAWLVIDEKSSKPVAFTSVLPRLVKVDGQDIICWNCCDFSVDIKYRTLGVAIKLRRMAKECVDNGEIQALYAHPNDRMKVAHEKVGHYQIGKMQRYVKLLSLKQQIKKVTKSQILAGVTSPAADLFLKLANPAIKFNKHYSVEHLENEEFSSEYDNLFQEVSKHYRILGDRGSKYLTWRFGQNPLYRTRRIIIQKGNTLAGYIIFYTENGVAVLKDILCLPDQDILAFLLTQWAKIMKKEKITSLSATFMDQNPLIKFFQKAGFKVRPDESSVYAYASNGLQETWTDGANWYMTVGDRDV